jgi:hypothetical protein
MYPVNYGIRFSDPVTTLTTSHARDGVGADLIGQPDLRQLYLLTSLLRLARPCQYVN